jgi:hypothetical protein
MPAIPYIVAAASVASSASQAHSAEKASNKSIVKYNPTEYQSNPEYEESLRQVGNLVSNNQSQPIFDMGKNYTQNVLGEGYSAYTPEQTQKMIADQTGLARNQFAVDENRISSRLAGQGLSGSGVAGMDWGGQQGRENKAISDIVSNVGNKNIDATQLNKSQALGMLPSLSQMGQIPLQNQMAYSGILGSQNADKNAFNQWNAQMQQNAKMANAGVYNQQYMQNQQIGAANNAATGKALGQLASNIKLQPK